MEKDSQVNWSAAGLDPLEVASSLAQVSAAWMMHWPDFYARLMEHNQSVLETVTPEMVKILSDGQPAQKTTKDPQAAFLDLVKQYSLAAQKYHSLLSQWLKKVVEDTPEVDPGVRQRSLFWTSQLLSALAPSNFFWTNPGAVQRFLNSQGESLQLGIRDWLDDNQRGDNLVKLVDDSAFKLGDNIATTPGQVVFRNELLELIQYAPATAKTYAVPIVLIQPWINKYYIFDLSRHNSFVRYLVERGFSVFIVSWKNPTPQMRHVTFDDYMIKGALAAINVAREICGVPQVHAAGYCIGGTALAALMAWLNQEYPHKERVPVVDWTLFSTLTDFSEPGVLGVFTGEKAIEAIEKRVAQDGYLDSQYIGLAFRLLNPDSLIWRYVVNNYLYGQMPPKSDMLYWNCDSTRLPEAMCSFYLREFYLHNKLVQKNAMVLGRHPIDLGSIVQPAYIVGAQQDHISPWRSTYQTGHLVQGPVRYVLANEGHITGIVNPPLARSKKKYRARKAEAGQSPDEWLEAQVTQQGSWWPDWVKWLSPRSLPQQEPPPVGCEAYPPLQAAPGQYVLEK